MKKAIMMLLLTVAIAATATGQTLHINKFLESKDKHYTEGVKQIIIKGNKLKPYNLNYYLSFTLLNKSRNPTLAETMERAVRADGKSATDRKEIMLGGKLYYAIYALPQTDDANRYIFYKNTTLKGNGKEVIVVYMSGTATLDEIKKKFKLN